MAESKFTPPAGTEPAYWAKEIDKHGGPSQDPRVAFGIKRKTPGRGAFPAAGIANLRNPVSKAPLEAQLRILAGAPDERLRGGQQNADVPLSPVGPHEHTPTRIKKIRSVSQGSISDFVPRRGGEDEDANWFTVQRQTPQRDRGPINTAQFGKQHSFARSAKVAREAAGWELDRMREGTRASGKPIENSDYADANPEYLHHATALDRAHEIAQVGLKTFRPNHGTEQNAWPDGGAEKRSYFHPDPKVASIFHPEGKPAMLRVKAAEAGVPFFRERHTGDFFARKPIPANKIEIQTEKGWIPLQQHRGLQMASARASQIAEWRAASR